MKRLVMGLCALSAALGAPALAAEPANWAGCYVGINAGYAWGKVDFSSGPNPVFVAGAAAPALTTAIGATAPNSFSPDGFTAGGGVGCNMQAAAWVYGFEADFNYSDLRASVQRGPFPTPFSAPHVWQESYRSDWFGTLRGRIGYAVTPTSLIYFTGGMAFGDTRWTKALDFPGFTGFRYEGSGRATSVGWTIGGGYEFIWSGPWSVKIEYLYIDFGSYDAVARQNALGSSAAWIHTADITENIVRVGLNYRY